MPNYDEVPADYPYSPTPGALAGVQPKLRLTSFEGKFYSPGNAPDVRWRDWQYSLGLVHAMVDRCRESKRGKRAHMTEHDIILQYYERAIAGTGRYGTEVQLKWAFTKVAETLSWPLPDVCRLTNNTGDA